MPTERRYTFHSTELPTLEQMNYVLPATALALLPERDVDRVFIERKPQAYDVVPEYEAQAIIPSGIIDIGGITKITFAEDEGDEWSSTEGTRLYGVGEGIDFVYEGRICVPIMDGTRIMQAGAIPDLDREEISEDEWSRKKTFLSCVRLDYTTWMGKMTARAILHRSSDGRRFPFEIDHSAVEGNPELWIHNSIERTQAHLEDRAEEAFIGDVPDRVLSEWHTRGYLVLRPDEEVVLAAQAAEEATHSTD